LFGGFDLDIRHLIGIVTMRRARQHGICGHKSPAFNPTTEVHAEARKRGEIQIPVKKGFSISNLRVSAPARDDFL
jgi:hypothetical protein